MTKRSPHETGGFLLAIAALVIAVGGVLTGIGVAQGVRWSQWSLIMGLFLVIVGAAIVPFAIAAFRRRPPAPDLHVFLKQCDWFTEDGAFKAVLTLFLKNEGQASAYDTVVELNVTEPAIARSSIANAVDYVKPGEAWVGTYWGGVRWEAGRDVVIHAGDWRSLPFLVIDRMPTRSFHWSVSVVAADTEARGEEFHTSA